MHSSGVAYPGRSMAARDEIGMRRRETHVVTIALFQRFAIGTNLG